MAIEFDLDLGTPLSPTQVASELCEVGRALGLFDATVTPALLLGEGATTHRRMWIQVFATDPRPWNVVIVDLGFTPTVTVGFRESQSTDRSAQDDDMILLVSGLLDRVPGDAVLHFQSEEIWLLRRGDELSLNEQEEIWPPQRLAAMHQPYRRATHAFS
jgi:hypothetical protein